MNPQTIWNEAQNRPSLIARDLEALGVPADASLHVLLRRGGFKWFAARRDLIRTKDAWKARIRDTIAAIRDAKTEQNRLRLAYLRGYLRAYEECRAEVRAICHSPRWRAPDNDPTARRWLERCLGVDGDGAHPNHGC